MDGQLYVVRGRTIVAVDGNEIRRAAHESLRVVVDLGTGDGRWVYRAAKAHPDWCCIGIDANAASMRESSWRASRKASRGGASNAWFIRAAAECLPEALFSIADEVRVQHPWGSLRRLVQGQDQEGLRRLVRIAKPGATFHVALNLLPTDGGGHSHLTGAYAGAGLEIQKLGLLNVSPSTSWGKRLGHGAPAPILMIEAKVGLNGS